MLWLIVPLCACVFSCFCFCFWIDGFQLQLDFACVCLSVRARLRLLVELDGVEPLRQVTMLAATNRPDIIVRLLHADYVLIYFFAFFFVLFLFVLFLFFSCERGRMVQTIGQSFIATWSNRSHSLCRSARCKIVRVHFIHSFIVLGNKASFIESILSWVVDLSLTLSLCHVPSFYK